MNNDFRNYAKTTIYISEQKKRTVLTENQCNAKLWNIRAFWELDRDGLMNCQLERQTLMYETAAHEKIYIKYPGKESGEKYAESGENKVINPYDFRPELYLPDDSLAANLSFVEIIEALIEYAQIHSKDDLRMIAVFITHIAFMYDYSFKELSYPSNDVKCAHGQRIILDGEKSVTFGRYFMKKKSSYEFLRTLDDICIPQKGHRKRLCISMEAFIRYIEILVQQEDCKYAYLASSHKKDPSISVETGRINSCYTMLHAIKNLLQGESCDRIIRDIEFGVSPIKPKDIPEITDGIITVEEISGGIARIDTAEFRKKNLPLKPMEKQPDEQQTECVEVEVTENAKEQSIAQRMMQALRNTVNAIRQAIRSLVDKFHSR